MIEKEKPAGIADKKLVENFLGGDEAAFSGLMKIYLKPIYNFIFRFARGREAAEDLTQETFFKVWKNLRRFDPEKSFRTWIYTIAKNSAFDYLKKKKELPFSRFEDQERNNILENVPDDEILPDEILERENIAEDLEKVLQKLPPHYRAVLLLHYKEEFTLHEIAEILDEPYNTVKSRHRRGLEKLKIFLDERIDKMTKI